MRRLVRWYSRRAALLAIIMWLYVGVVACIAAGWVIHDLVHR